MSTPSPERSSPTPTGLPQGESPITSTFRLLKLRSDQADTHYSPTHKMWLIPTITANPGVQFKFTIRSFKIFNAFRNFPKEKRLAIKIDDFTAKLYTVPPGNYSAEELAQILTYKMSGDTETNCVNVTYDSSNNAMNFDPAITLSFGNYEYPNEIYQEIGVPEPDFTAKTGLEIFRFPMTKSPVPVNLSGVTGINIQSNLSINNIPISGWLGYLPMNVPYGQLYSYEDHQGTPRLCMNHTISNITIQLMDQDGNDLGEKYCIPDVPSTTEYHDSYYQFAYQNFLPAWEIVLALQVVSYDGFADKVSLPLVNRGVAVHQDT